MKLSEFRFDLPLKSIAKHPNENRDDSRLMVVNRKTGKFEHRVFKDIIQYFNDGDVLVAALLIAGRNGVEKLGFDRGFARSGQELAAIGGR